MSEAKSEFEKTVFPAEIEEINERRTRLEIEKVNPGPEPSTDLGLAGLAVSGGGIRSATFSLGIIQGLSKYGILKRLDYLSTVSGGGYTGSCVSSLLNDEKNLSYGEKFPLKYTSNGEETPALTHLRNSSNYLSPGGLLEKLRIPNVLLRGTLLNLFVFLPYIMALVFLTEVAFETTPHWDYLPIVIPPLVLSFIVLAISFPLAIKLFRKNFNWRGRNTFELILTIPLLLAGIVLALIPLLVVVRFGIEHRFSQIQDFLTNLGPFYWWILALSCVAVLVLFMMVGKASENISKLKGKLVLILVGLLGPLTIFSIFFMLCLWQIDSPFMPINSVSVLNDAVEQSEQNPRTPWLIPSATEELEDMPHTTIADHFNAAFGTERGSVTPGNFITELTGRNIDFYPDAMVFCSSGPTTPCNTETSDDQLFEAEPRPIWVIVDHWQAGDESDVENGWQPLPSNVDLATVCPPLASRNSVPDGDVVDQDWVDQNCTYFEPHSSRSLYIHGAYLGLFDNLKDWIFFGAFISLLIFNRYMLDINITSPHGFYRDRLSKAYLFKVRDNGVEQNDVLRLQSLNSKGTVAPYHLINVTLNLQGSKDPDLRGRMCDFFIFSKRYSGGDRTGYVRTDRLEKCDHHLNLGTAVAISGAAAAPNMGVVTHRSLIFLLTLLNIRLGYWLPNPSKVKNGNWIDRIRFAGARPSLIWKEAMGALDSKGSHVNVSDGGHLENLGIYPLLKRRCKFIVAIDGEADPDFVFDGLVKTMRFARIDMGTEIDLDLEEIRKDAALGRSKEHFSVGKIRYGNGEVGHLLYFKLSVTGDEPEYVRAYRAKNPEFPHEPTSDQFFSEDQFEAYRALGEHICKHAMEDENRLDVFSSLRDV